MTLNFDKMDSLEDYSSKVLFSVIDLPKSPMDFDSDFENLDALCQFVRNSYLNYLRKTLMENINECQKQHDPHVLQCVDICMAEMEKIALKRCMLASIYRQDMSSMISKVKTSTRNSMLYVSLQQIIESKNQKPLLNKYYGIENTRKQSVDVGITTEQNLNKVASSTQTENLIATNNNLTSNKPGRLFTKHIATVNGNKSNLPLCSSVMKSNGIESEMLFENLNHMLSTASSPLSREINVGLAENSNPQQSSNTNDLLSINLLLRDLQDSPEVESPRLENNLINVQLETVNQNVLEELPELPEPIMVHPSTIRPKQISKILGDKLKCERIAKEYEFLRSMKDIPQELHTRLNNKFILLFGRGHNYDNDPLSEEEQHAIAHKRIVKLVVQFMTPYYNEQRISRRMFKSLAKIISKTLMDRSYDPDEETVRKGVSEFFTGNRCIKRYEDIYNWSL
ncbi:Hypothetical protein CINCED_3A006817 [Cinara cedri]|uniref:Set2 Rpb1 interacting domain-containing protein n=1 Tax=Cinara cedri TaxID=506608 RepID=A0A5E4NJ98_9HEMI|nr:Hypothetical protein CINCED_3A006817 [Cinara cedri]